MPMMFFSTRVVPPTPPSFVKLKARASGVMIGAGASVPIKDHVPELINAVSPPAAIAATAEPVS